MAKMRSQLARFGSGKAVRRVEDDALLAGKGRFADDVDAPGEAHVAFLRSPHPHARIVAIDTATAAALPGVIAIFTGDDLVRAGVKPLPLSADFRRADGSPTATPPRHALAVDFVRHVGETVVAVVAATRTSAQDAVEAIDIRYDPLPMVVDAYLTSGCARAIRTATRRQSSTGSNTYAGRAVSIGSPTPSTRIPASAHKSSRAI